MFVSIILPTYNERENIADLIGTIKRVLHGLSFEIIVVDDNSPDGTWKVVEEISANDSRVKLIRRIDERGLATAIVRGISEAKGDVIIWMDCDFSHPPELIPMMLNELKRCDAVIASRYAPGGGIDAPFYRKVISLLGDHFASLILSLTVKDCTSGYIAIKRRVLSDIRIKPLGSGYGEYFIALLYDLQKKGFRINEIPYIYCMRKKGYSKTSANPFRFVRLMLSYFMTIILIRFFSKLCL